MHTKENSELTWLICYRVLYRKRTKKGKAYLQSKQEHAHEHTNAFFQENENYYQPAPIQLEPIGHCATAAAISKHEEAFQNAEEMGETASNASDTELIIGNNAAKLTPPPYENQGGTKLWNGTNNDVIRWTGCANLLIEVIL